MLLLVRGRGVTLLPAPLLLLLVTVVVPLVAVRRVSRLLAIRWLLLLAVTGLLLLAVARRVARLLAVASLLLMMLIAHKRYRHSVVTNHK